MNLSNKKAIDASWSQLAWKHGQPLDSLPIPFHALEGEGLDVARFCQRNWEPTVSKDGTLLREGLKSAISGGEFYESISADILDLLEQVQRAQTSYHLLQEESDAAPTDRALFVLSEIRATLQWSFDDGEDDERDVQLGTLDEAHEGASTQDAIAAALIDYAELAARVGDKLAGLGGFDLALVTEARDLARALRERSAGSSSPGMPAATEALELRNRLVTLLWERMQLVRAAARFVFRRDPDLLKKIASSYGRKLRANRKEAKLTETLKATQTLEATQA